MIAREDHLFGLLAVQSGFVDPVAFLDLWESLEDGERLPALLVSRGLLAPEDRDHLAYLVQRKMPAAASTPFSGAPTVATTAATSQRYQYLDRCGSGGMGDVWLAHDAHLDRDVAVKELKNDLVGNEAVRKRFLREARLTGQLDHPGIVPVFDLLPEEGGRLRYSMRLLRGRTMSEAIREMHRRREAGEDVSLERAALLQAFVAVCNTVGYAHSRGVLHRDLKPSNVQLGDFGEAVVLDWGLAGRLPGERPAAEQRMTSPGSVFGTPEFMSPEQAVGDVANVNERSDVYSLGAILYKLLTGVPPFHAGTMAETLALVRAGELTPVRQRRRDAPAGLAAICQKALSRRPADRFALATDLAAAVLHWQQSERDEALARLRTQEAEYRAILDSIPHIVWTSSPDGDNSFLNRRWYEYTGRSREDSSGGGLWKDALHPDDRDRTHEAFSAAVAAGRPFEVEYRLLGADGVYRWFLGRGVPQSDGSGRTTRWYGTCTEMHGRTEGASGAA